MEVIGNSTTHLVYFAFNKIQGKISRKIGYDTYVKTLKLPAVAFENMSSGEIINRVTYDTEAIIGTFQRLIDMIARILSALLILIYIFMNSYFVGIEIFIFLFIYAFIVKHFTKVMKEKGEKTKLENDKFTALTNESVRGIREIKTLGIIKHLSKKMSVITNCLVNTSNSENKESMKYDIIASIMCGLLEVGSFMTVAVLVGLGKCSITFFIALTYYIYRYTWIIESITSFTKDFSKLLVSLNRIAEILNNQLYQDVLYGDIELKNPVGVIEFQNVTFGYPNEEVVLKDFSVHFPSCKKIAIVGSSGGGKTTIFNLITRIFDVNDGNIYLDHINIKDLTEESLRNNISIIRQEPFLFNASIKENFKILDERVTLKEIRKYCSLASIDNYIMSLPKKYDTILGEGGVNLSGGQKQRIAIARSLLKKSKIILMDEATSALDNISQDDIKSTIHELVKDHTVIIVAHRLSTIIDADIIYVIDNGKVIDFGTHEELLKKCTFYQKLHFTENRMID